MAEAATAVCCMCAYYVCMVIWQQPARAGERVAATVLDIAAHRLHNCFCTRLRCFQGDIRQLMDDVCALRPTLFAGVPRVFERVYNGVRDKVGCALRHG